MVAKTECSVERPVKGAVFLGELFCREVERVQQNSTGSVPEGWVCIRSRRLARLVQFGKADLVVSFEFHAGSVAERNPRVGACLRRFISSEECRGLVGGLRSPSYRRT